MELEKQEVVIGRENCDLEVEDLEMSRRHAVLRRASRRLEVEDLGSKNGTFVNGKRIEEPTPVGGGAEIRVGTTVMVIEGALPVSSTGKVPEEIDPAVTRASEVPSEIQEAATATAAVAAAEAAPAPGQPPTSAAPAQPTPPPAGPIGEFRPPEKRRPQRGLASRSWVPVALSFGTVLVTAVLLVLYFGLRATP
jgi:hypothetical protein